MRGSYEIPFPYEDEKASKVQYELFSQFGDFFLFKETGTLDNNVFRKSMFIVHK